MDFKIGLFIGGFCGFTDNNFYRKWICKSL